MKKLFALLLCFATIFALSIPTAANGSTSLKLGDEIPMPSNIDFVVHDTCWEHDWFGQFHAREDGWYIVVSRVANLNGSKEQGFNRVYIDIYNAECVFQKELSLNNSDANIVCLITETAVEIYLSNCYLSYDLETEAVNCHYAPDNYVQNSDLVDLLWESKQQIGEWTYKSKGSPQMRHALIREKDGQVQTILKCKGSSLSFPNIIPYIFSSAITILAFLWIVKKKCGAKRVAGGSAP